MPFNSKNKNKPNAVFYTHNLQDGTLEWFGDTKKVLGLNPSQINKKEKFLDLLHKKDKKIYEININGNAEEVSFEYSLEVGSKQLNLKERAIRQNIGDKKFLYGVITSQNENVIKAGKGKYNLSSKNILAGEYDGILLESLSKCFSEGNSKRYNYLLLLISIDNLPMIVSWHGEQISNKVMEDLSRKIKAVLTDGSIFHRIGDEQFAVILKNPVASEIEQITSEIARIVSLYKNPNLEDTVHLRLSMGSVHFPLGVKDEYDAINKAFLGLTHAKGKTYEFYCDFEDARREHIDAQNEMSQLHYLQEAFNTNRLVLAYQPIISGKDGTTQYYEVLLRINDGNGRYDSAGRFIPIAEKMGTVEAIDEFVLRKVIEELKNSKGVKLCINVSNLTTGSENWLKICNDLLKDSEIAKRISMEITETAANKDLRKTAYFTASMQALGCTVALDDFGVGYTSFRQLRSLSVDTVKIDGSYILGLEENKENLIFIKSLIDFNRSYGLKTVAECVETGEVAKKLMDMGCDLLQGYYFGAPKVAKPWEQPPQTPIKKPA
ncbi:MAG: GGDEF domain-containing phosphodiesterase [Rickettsiales bacterium]|nr:GGDEF domain-containing phosphodiesterase [Rickettsiales bacterium]